MQNEMCEKAFHMHLHPGEPHPRTEPQTHTFIDSDSDLSNAVGLFPMKGRLGRWPDVLRHSRRHLWRVYAFAYAKQEGRLLVVPTRVDSRRPVTNWRPSPSGTRWLLLASDQWRVFFTGLPGDRRDEPAASVVRRYKINYSCFKPSDDGTRPCCGEGSIEKRSRHNENMFIDSMQWRLLAGGGADTRTVKTTESLLEGFRIRFRGKIQPPVVA